MAEIVINQTETTLNQPNTEIVNKQLDALIDKSKLPQNTIESPNTNNSPKDKFIINRSVLGYTTEEEIKKYLDAVSRNL